MDEIKAIFAAINSHMVEGVMLHDQLYQLFLFLRLNKYAKEQKKRYDEESKARQKLNEYYIKHRNSLIDNKRVIINDLIPVEWYQKDRFSIEGGDVSKAVRYAINTWTDWERRTKDLYADSYGSALRLGFMAEADYILTLVKDVDKELAEAEDLHLFLEAINYDVIEIMDKNG